MPRKPLPIERAERAETVRLHHTGLTAREVADAQGIHYTTVYQRLKREGLTPHRSHKSTNSRAADEDQRKFGARPIRASLDSPALAAQAERTRKEAEHSRDTQRQLRAQSKIARVLDQPNPQW